MKTKEELNALKEEEETVSSKLIELTEEELAQIYGGMDIGKVQSTEGLSSLSLPDMVAELKKHGLVNLGGAVATPSSGGQSGIKRG